MRALLQHWVFGAVRFQDSEEIEAFRFHFLTVAMLSGAFCAGLILLNDQELHRASPRHVYALILFMLCTLALWRLLRGRKERYLAVALAYEIIGVLLYISGLINVPQDPLRVLWFIVNIPGVYILLGQRAGAFVTILTLSGLGWGNRYLPIPYSSQSLVTLLAGLTYIGVFFHFYGARFISFFARMRQSNERLTALANQDALTGLYNRRHFDAVAPQQFEAVKRGHYQLGLIIIDVDYFKQYNDRYGHQQGDVALRAVAGALRDSLQRGSDQVFRVGGEEFAVMVTLKSDENLVPLLARLNLAVLALGIEHASAPSGTLSISVGAAVIGGARWLPRDAAYSLADGALYEAKAAGRNRYVLRRPGDPGDLT